MRKRRPGTLLIGLGGAGFAVGSLLGGDSVRMGLLVAPIVVGIAAWHFRRFGPGKLLVLLPLTYIGVTASLFDPGAGAAVWDRDLSDTQLVGAWLIGASGVAVLVGVVWSSLAERPPGIKTLRAFAFGRGPGGASEPSSLGVDVADGQTPPSGWWQASDQRWYPPETDPRSSSRAEH